MQQVQEQQLTPRNFVTVFKAIRQELPVELRDELTGKAHFWAPEIAWNELSNFVNLNVPKKASDPMSVKVNSILCGKTEDEIVALFTEDGYM